MSQTVAPPPHHHTLFEDAQGLAAGAALSAAGVYLLRASGLVTGGTAGLAVLLSYTTGWGFGPLFLAINLPFFALALKRLGWAFVVKSLIAVAAVSALAEALPRFLTFAAIEPLVAAVLFGFIGGAGLLAIFRHGASLGGVGVVALIVQDRTGFRAGWVQLIFDAGIFLAAFAVIPPWQVAMSLVGAVVLNLVIAVNHRRDWYIPQ